MPSLLLVLTGADHWTLDDGSRHPTGFSAEEFVAPTRVLRDAGVEARARWIHVVPYEGAWTFKHERGEPEGRFRTQKEAIEAAKEHARAHGDWELVIQGATDGSATRSPFTERLG